MRKTLKTIPKQVLKKIDSSSRLRVSAFICLFGVIGAVATILTHATGPFASIEPESGTVAGHACAVSDSNASAGSAVKFGGCISNVLGAATNCSFQMADMPLQQAFCDDFSGHTNTGTQTGDLDSVLWGVSRRFIFGSSFHDAMVPSHNACSGGGTTGNPATGDPNTTYFGPATPPAADARICNGRYVSSSNDGAIDVSALDAYPKQPFDFNGRTGTVVFDVTADSAGNHAAWPEFWITDEPIPGVIRCITTCPNTTHAENSIGFSLAGAPNENDFSKTGVDVIEMSKGGIVTDLPFTTYNSITKGCLAGHSYQCSATQMNHIEVRVSVSRIDIYGTDAGSTTLKHLAGADITGNLGFTKGLVWINDAHYNARKQDEPCECGTQYDHSWAWDNLGFDGPKTYRDIGYDTPLAMVPGPTTTQWHENTTSVGYAIDTGSKSWTLPNVTWQQTPTKAKVVFNVYSYDDVNTITASLNGHTAVSKQVNGHPVGVNGNPPTNGFAVWSMSIDLPIGDATQGTNTLTMTATSPTTIVGNVSVIFVAGAPVP